MSERSATDCRDCRHCGGVVEEQYAMCLEDPGEPLRMSWPVVVGVAECREFRLREPLVTPPCACEPGEPLAACPAHDGGKFDGHGADSLAAGTKDTNPKDIVGSTKLPLDLVPPLTIAYASLAHLNGALKYGKGNWRKAGVRASIYAAAAKRHIDSWLDGEEEDPDDGVPHLSAVLACIGIILDSRACGKLTDDRMMRNAGYRNEIMNLTCHVKRLQELHKDKHPHHFTIADSEVAL